MLHFVGFSNSPALQFADSLQVAGEFRWASSEYERAAYLATDNTVRTSALLEKAKCLLSLKEPASAYSTTERIYFIDLTDSLHYTARYNSAFYAYLSKDFEEANSQLLFIEQFMPDSMVMQSSILHALTLNELRRWDEAKVKLVNWTHYTHADDSLAVDSLLTEIDLLYNPKKYPKYKDPQKAEVMSSIAPGLGQLYTGHVWDAAFNAGMVLLGLGIGAYGIFVVQYYVSGVILGYSFFQRFYIAGQKRADFLARKYNYEKLRKHNDLLLNPLLALDQR